MDINISKDKKRLTAEQIDEYKNWLNKAEPYTDEEVENLEFDPINYENYDIDRLKAHTAKQILEEYGLLN